MSASIRNVAIVGSGIVGSIMAYLLVRRGTHVTVFEKGPDYPYPHAQQFEEERYGWANPAFRLPGDLKGLTQSGNYPGIVDAERHLIVGGSAARWGGMTDRLDPCDFTAGSRHGTGLDWPFGYDEIEPYYCAAEELLGVSGDDEGDPFAAPRSRPYPLPPFEFTYDIARLAQRMRSRGLELRPSPQARNRVPHDGRPACENHGVCRVCPIGARYSPRHHLRLALESGRCELRTDASVRRLVPGAAGRVRSLVYRQGAVAADQEHSADLFVVAAGALESARLLLLSREPGFPDGIGNRGGCVGRYLLFHHIRDAHLHYDEDLFPGRSGPEMGHTRQFINPPTRGRHGGVLVQMRSASAHFLHAELRQDFKTGAELLDALKGLRRCELVVLHCESDPSPHKWVTLSEKRDRFGDPFAHVHYQTSEYDGETYRYATGLLGQIAAASRATDGAIVPESSFNNGAHHMGGCRMAETEDEGVVDASCRVHGTSNLYVVGGGNFPANTAVHPTLTMVALAIRAAERIAAL